MEDRTWLLFTKAACSRDQRVRGQVIAQREGLASRSGAFERLDLGVDLDDDRGCSTAATAEARAATNA